MARQALFVMAKEPRVGQVKTRLCPPLAPDVAARLYECFLSDVLDVVGGLSDVDRVVAYAPAEAGATFARLTAGRFLLLPQEGDHLGARLENVFRTLFERGYDRVLALSTDSPDVPAAHLEDAFRRLAEAPVVLGPCPDGGYYLIGLSRLIPEIFRGMPWSTDRVLRETAARAAAVGAAVSYLPVWYDVDTAADLDRLVRSLADGAPSQARAPRTAAFCRQYFGDRPLTTA